MAGKGGKTTRLDGQQVDTSTYGPPNTVATADLQPFWADDIADPNSGVDFNAGDAGITLGIIGDLYGQNAWDVVELNSRKLPGLWSATATPAIQLDVQKPNGYDGAALVNRGYVNAGITLTGRLWTPMQWAMFQRYLPTFWAPPNKMLVNDQKRQKGQIVGEQKRVSVYHPALAALNIYALVINQITPPEETGKVGERQIKILAKQYVSQPQKQKSATKKISGVGVDRTVQAQRILGQNATLQANRKGIANLPPPPSQDDAHIGASEPLAPAWQE